MGDLHTEMAFLSSVGDWMEGSGWTNVYGKSQISTRDRVDSFLRGSKVNVPECLSNNIESFITTFKIGI